MSLVATKNSCLWIPTDCVDCDRLEKEYTFIPKYENHQPVEVFRYNQDSSLIGVPRNENPSSLSVVDQTVFSPSLKHKFLGTLRKHQVSVVEDFSSLVGRGTTDLIVNADAGSGKTVMLLWMLTQLKTPALVIVPKSDLIDQWKKRILQFTTIKESEIGYARQKRCDFQGKSIVLGMLQSLYKDRYGPEFNGYFGAVVFDELHRMGSFHFSKVVGMFPARYRLGATATLRRSDRMEKVFYAHLGKKIITPMMSSQPVPKVAIFNYKKSSGIVPRWAKDKIRRRGVIISLLAKNKMRTQIIANFTASVASSGRQTLVISERIDQLKELRASLSHTFSPEDIGLYIGKTPEKEREAIAKNAKIILATTSMLGLGTDIPTLRGLVIATPVSDVEQIVGRICRENPSLKEPFVVDISDTCYPDTKVWMQKRFTFYSSIGCDSEYVEV
jgi:superfamily II DNA or RNA helicase